MGYTDYPLDHVMPEGVKEFGQAVNQFILWNRHEIFLDGPISPHTQRVQLSQTPTLSPMAHALATTPSQQEAQQLPTPPSQQEAQQLPTPPRQQEAQQLPTPPGQQEAQQLPCPQQQIAPTEIEAPKDKEASLVQGMPPSSSSPHDTIHKDQGMYKTKLIQIQRTSYLWQ
jgi:hypothetical protein